MLDASKQADWTKPAAAAIPEEGYFEDKVEQGRYGTIFPRTPACYGFSIIAKIIPGREPAFYEYAQKLEKAVADQPDCLAVLKLHYLRWNLFTIKGETYFQYMGIFDTDFDTTGWGAGTGYPGYGYGAGYGGGCGGGCGFPILSGIFGGGCGCGF